jgi:transposase, IS30 family
VPSLIRKASGKRKYTQEQKDRFFAVFDRVGSVAVAAEELGFNQMTCYQWTQKAGIGAGREKHTQEKKDLFFTVLQRAGSVTAAASELGLNRNTCYRWIQKAGRARKRSDRPQREDFRRLRDAGMSRREAAAALGIHRTTAEEWDVGIRKTRNGRIYPGGRTVDYTREVSTTTTPGVRGISLAGLDALDKTLDGRFLSLQDRERIRDLRSSGASLRAIAAALGRSPSTVSREIARNSQPVIGYQPYAAHRKAASRRPRPKERKLLVLPRLRDHVEAKLLLRLSPEQISKTLIRDFPDDQEMRVTHETIYQALYIQGRGGLRRELATALRTGRARRKPHRNGDERRPRFVDPMVMISERPPEIEDRAVPGHWEGDLITGALNQSAIGTLVERSTRYVMLVHLPTDHTAESVRDGLIATMSTLPAHLRGSLTWDQGVEMAAHKSFTLATDIQVYFCDPASPWQRGSNENTNGLLRQYFPKGTDLSVYGPEDLEHVAQELNARPRKTLGWDTPAERLRDLLITT